MARGMSLWHVEVFRDDDVAESTFVYGYTVLATTSVDARLLAFCLDGGWGGDEMDDGAIELAFMWTSEPELVQETTFTQEGD